MSRAFVNIATGELLPHSNSFLAIYLQRFVRFSSDGVPYHRNRVTKKSISLSSCQNLLPKNACYSKNWYWISTLGFSTFSTRKGTSLAGNTSFDVFCANHSGPQTSAVEKRKAPKNSTNRVTLMTVRLVPEPIHVWRQDLALHHRIFGTYWSESDRCCPSWVLQCDLYNVQPYASDVWRSDPWGAQSDSWV